MVVQHNLTAMNSNRMLGLSNSVLANSSEKLSSGYRVNRAADDAAGLAISEKMRRQIRGLTQASANCQDGVAICQIADGALDEVHDMLKRCEELAVKAANDTNTSEDREYIQSEINALVSEIDRVHSTTVFNEQNVFSGNGITPLAKAPSGNISFITDSGIMVEIGLVDADGNRIASADDSSATGTANSSAVADSELAQFAKLAAANAVSKLASTYPNLFSAASTSNIQVGLDLSNIDGKGNTLASASLSMRSSSGNVIMSYRMKIDTTDYPINQFASFSDAKKADLAAVIAHEMTHLMMYDTVTNKMVGSGSFPQWFIEGTAQTSSGDNGWLSNRLNAGSTDEQIEKYMAKLSSMPYGAGYLATMYLGMSASGEPMSDVSSANIAKGLDKILTDVATGKSFSDAIKDNTGGKFTSVSYFEKKFKEASGDSLAFARDLINERGADGAGSILYPLNSSEAAAFDPAFLSSAAGSYTINPENKWFSNGYGANINWPQIGDHEGEGGGNGNGFMIQAGAESGQYIHLQQFNISAEALLGGETLDVIGNNVGAGTNGYTSGNISATHNSSEAAGNVINLIKEADRRVSVVRSYYGAVQNRLEHTIKNLNNIVENTTAAESQIRDTDMAREMVRFSNTNILAQAGQAMLAQSNQANQGILSLLQ